MKFAKLFVAVAIAASLSFSSARAGEVNFSGSSVNMGSVTVGQYGTISNIYQTLFTLPPNVIGSGEVFGFLPNKAIITFTYTLTGLVDGMIQGFGAYNHNIGGTQYQGSSLADSDGYFTANGTVNGLASTPLVLASANLTPGNPAVGTVTISNTSGSLAQFQSLFFGILQALPRGVGTINYVVSSVPLPAALPMLGALLAGMFGFAARRRKLAA